MESCDIYGAQNVPKRPEASPMTGKTHPRLRFSHIRRSDPPPPGTRTKNPERHCLDRNDSQHDTRIRKKATARKQKIPRQRPRLHDVVSYDKTSKHPFLLPRRNQQRLRHNKKGGADTSTPPRCRPKASTAFKQLLSTKINVTRRENGFNRSHPRTFLPPLPSLSPENSQAY